MSDIARDSRSRAEGRALSAMALHGQSEAPPRMRVFLKRPEDELQRAGIVEDDVGVHEADVARLAGRELVDEPVPGVVAPRLGDCRNPGLEPGPGGMPAEQPRHGLIGDLHRPVRAAVGEADDLRALAPRGQLREDRLLEERGEHRPDGPLLVPGHDPDRERDRQIVLKNGHAAGSIG